MKRTFETTFINRFNGEVVKYKTTITDREEERARFKRALAIMYNRKKLERKYPRIGVINNQNMVMWLEYTKEV